MTLGGRAAGERHVALLLWSPLFPFYRLRLPLNVGAHFSAFFSFCYHYVEHIFSAACWRGVTANETYKHAQLWLANCPFLDLRLSLVASASTAPSASALSPSSLTSAFFTLRRYFVDHRGAQAAKKNAGCARSPAAHVLPARGLRLRNSDISSSTNDSVRDILRTAAFVIAMGRLWPVRPHRPALYGRRLFSVWL